MTRITLTSHWKFLRLASAVGSKVLARGILEMLWESSAIADDPYVGTSADIERLCEWKGAPGALTKALLMEDDSRSGAGFIEVFKDRSGGIPRYQLHDFAELGIRVVRHEQDAFTVARRCIGCGEEFLASHARNIFCSHRCQMRVRRRGGPLAVVINDDIPDTSARTCDASDAKRDARAFDKSKSATKNAATSPTGRAPDLLSTPDLSTTADLISTKDEPPRDEAVRHVRHARVTDASRTVTDPPVDDSPPLLTFPTVGKSGPIWHLSRAQLTEWQSLYPNIDVLSEARQALAWIQADGTRRKTARGMPRCLVNWLNRAVDSTRSHRSAPARRSPEHSAEPAVDWQSFLDDCPHTPKCESAWRCDQLYQLAVAKGLARPR